MTTGKFYNMIDEMVGDIADQLSKHGAYQTDAAMADVLAEIGEDLENRLGWLIGEDNE